MKRISLSFLLMLMVHLYALAQVTTSGMNGLVKGGNEPLIGATIVAVHVPSGTSYGTVTNMDGRFILQGMRTGGPYQIKVSYIGFKTAVYENIHLSLGDNLVLNVDLKEDLGELDEVVVVATRS